MISPFDLIRGTGSKDSAIFVLGTQPGWMEGRDREAFVGKTGDELRRFFNGDELPDFSHVYATNLYKTFIDQDYHYGAADLAFSEPILHRELQEVLPTLIVTLGAPTMHWLLGEDVDLDAVEAIPWWLPVDCYHYPGAPDGTVVFPITHPASAFRNPEMSPYVVNGFTQLAAYLNGELEPRGLYADPHPVTIYREVTTRDELLMATQDWTEGRSVGLDTEGWPGAPWSLQFSSIPGTGYLIRQANRELLTAFADLAIHRRIVPAYHSALHDLQMNRALGIPELAALPFDDTMIQAYLLQIEPQGLKPSCLRHCNMKMSSYQDIMGDTSDQLMRDYLTWIWDSENWDHEEARQREFERRRTTQAIDKKTGLPKFRKDGTPVFPRITKVPTLAKSPLFKACTRVLQSQRPRQLWEDQTEDIRVAAYHRLGPPPEPSLDCVPRAAAVDYGCRDADGTVRLQPRYRERIRAMALESVYALELATYPLIERMQRIGVKPDLQQFADLSDVLEAEIDSVRQELCATTGRDHFNANSGDQVADYLFGELQLPSLKDTSSGRGSTNDKILEALEKEHPEHPVVGRIRYFRETYKLKHTFVDRIPDYVNRWPFDGRVHATFRTTRVVTGRLAAADPNLLAQPEYGKFAKEFQRGWVADDGHVLGAWDESQVELRGLAHLSQDPVLCAVYRGERRNPDGSPIDLHAALAHRIFGGDIRAYMHKCPERLAAKAVNFGIPMGMTCRGLSVELRKNGVDADEDTAQRWLDETLELYAGAKTFMDACVQEAWDHGYIRCMSGRIRYIGGIRSRDERVREEAERFSFSTKIQESATFIMKQAEQIVWEDVLPHFWKQGKWVEPILQVHDCLKMECEAGLEQELHLFMVDAMTQVPHSFSVPLEVEGEYGLTFADMKGF